MPHQKAQSSTSVPPLSFPKFGLLPLELRIKIWDYAQLHNHNRIVTIAYSPQSKSFSSPTKPPATLHTIHESRFLALKIYTLSFETSQCNTPKIYFSPSTDILTFNWSIYRKNVDNIQLREREIVESVRIKHSELLWHGTAQLGLFRALKKVHVDCDGELEIGECFGGVWVVQFVEGMEAGKGVELVCSRGGHVEGSKCSRHWWFKDWNARVLGKKEDDEEEEEEKKERRSWDLTLKRCLGAVERHESEERESRRIAPLAEEFAAIWPRDDTSPRTLRFP